MAPLKAQLDQRAWDFGPTEQPTTAQQQAIDTKIAASRNFAAAHLDVDGLALPDTGVPASKTLLADQAAQTTTYYCGPAAVKEALGQVSIGGIQANLADAMKTTTDGTAWSGVNANVAHPTGHPVPDVLNDRLSSHGKSFTYIATAVDYSPTSGQISDYKEHVQADVYDGYPLVGDAYEVPGGPHLTGHPNITIYHWFDIRGYSGSGATTDYEDSVHGSTISWASGVPAYSSKSSTTIAHIVGGRGYVW